MMGLVKGKQIRFAPARDGKPASFIWKVWVQGSDVYAQCRRFGGSLKLSVHASGQIHLRQAPKQKQDLAPLMQLGSGPWLCGFELRFFLNDAALMPFRERESLKNQTALLITVPNEYALFVDLIISPPGSMRDMSLPVEFLPGGEALWCVQLGNGRVAALIGRILALDEENRGHIRSLREELKVTYNARKKSEGPYVETHYLNWSAGGNVIFIMPQGDEAIRSEQELVLEDGTPSPPSRTFRYRSLRALVELIAPNQTTIAVIEIPEVDKQIDLRKGETKEVELGFLTMHLEKANLIEGSEFIVSPRKFSCDPNIDGAGLSPKESLPLPSSIAPIGALIPSNQSTRCN